MKLAETKIKMNQYSLFLTLRLFLPDAVLSVPLPFLWKSCNIGKGVISHKFFKTMILSKMVIFYLSWSRYKLVFFSCIHLGEKMVLFCKFFYLQNTDYN